MTIEPVRIPLPPPPPADPIGGRRKRRPLPAPPLPPPPPSDPIRGLGSTQAGPVPDGSSGGWGVGDTFGEIGDWLRRGIFREPPPASVTVDELTIRDLDDLPPAERARIEAAAAASQAELRAWEAKQARESMGWKIGGLLVAVGIAAGGLWLLKRG